MDTTTHHKAPRSKKANAPVLPGHSKAWDATPKALSALAAAPVSSSTDAVWASLAAQLVNATVGPVGPHEAICLAGETLNVDLANANPQITNANVYAIGNTIPAWGPGYAPYSSLVTTYATFLDWINLGGSTDPNIVSQLNTAAQNLNNAQSNFTSVTASAVTAWKTAQQINPSITFSAFVQTSYPTYLAAQSTLLGCQKAYDGLCQQAYGTGYEVIQADQNKVSSAANGGGALDYTVQNSFNMPCAVGAVQPANSVTTLPGSNPAAPASTLQTIYQPSYALDSSFATKYQEWQAASVAKNFTGGGTFTVTSSNQTYDWSSTGWSASGGVSFTVDFLRIGAQGSASSTAVSIDWTNSSTSVSVKFTGLGSFSIAPGAWYDAGAVATYNNELRSGAPTYFGPNGSLALLPTRIIVGFEPTITLTLSAADYSNVKTTFQAQATATIGIGPFVFGSASYSTYSGKQSISYNDATSTITLGPDLTTLPVLLGVVCTKLGDQV